MDASNAFKRLNREVALRNILHLCPSIGRVLVNIYRVGVNMYIGGESIMSVEDTTQGDPMTMAMYALGTFPLIHRSNPSKLIQQVWYADDGSAGGSLSNLLDWWHQLTDLGPKFGYYPNTRKSILLVKPDHLDTAQQLFSDHNLTILQSLPTVRRSLAHQSVYPSSSINGSTIRFSPGLMRFIAWPPSPFLNHSQPILL